MKKKTMMNVVSAGIYQLVLFVSNLIIPRLILVYYGSECNGIISSITQMLSLVSILRLGIAGSTRVELYKKLSINDVQGTSGIIRATQEFMRKITLAIVIYIGILAIFYPYMMDSMYSRKEIMALILILGLGTCSEYFFGITYMTLLDADQKMYFYTGIKCFLTVFNTVLVSWLMIVGTSIYSVKFTTTIIFMLCPIILNICVPKMYLLKKNVAADKSALKNRSHVMASSIANIIHENTDVVILTFFSTAKMISVYSVYNLVTAGLKSVISVFTNSLEPLFGRLWALKEYGKVRKGLHVYELLIAAFVSIIFSAAFLLIVPFVSLYTKGITDINYILPVYAVLVMLTQIVYCIRLPYLTIVQAAGKYKETKGANYLEAALNVAISMILTIKLNLYGVIIGTLIANLVRTLLYANYIYKELLPERETGMLKKMIWMCANMMISMGVYNAIESMIFLKIENWADWILCGILIVLISTVITLSSAIIFYRKDIKYILSFTDKRNGK